MITSTIRLSVLWILTHETLALRNFINKQKFALHYGGYYLNYDWKTETQNNTRKNLIVAIPLSVFSTLFSMFESSRNGRKLGASFPLEVNIVSVSGKRISCYVMKLCVPSFQTGFSLK